jgi:hypothetical protein
MNHTLINRLSAHIWATPNGQELAERIIRIAQNNYPECDRVLFEIYTDNASMGEVARCLGIPVLPPNDDQPRYRYLVQSTAHIMVCVLGPVVESALNLD